MPKKSGVILISLGAVLILAALLLFLYNRGEDRHAGQEAETLLADVRSAIEDAARPQQPDETPAVEEPVYEYAGIITIPAISRELPVIRDWSYPALKTAPCRQFGSAEGGDLVIAAHNYKSHFGYLDKLQSGDAVTFTDMDGTVYQYTVAEVRQLVAAGYKDINLLGQNVNSYGKDLAEPMDFADLLELVNAIPGDFLIRFMTSHPKDATQKLFETMARCEKVAPVLHLPFQAGNDRILKAMNRRHTRAQYLEKIAALKALIPDIVLTSDIIVGFPGETTEEFEDTLKVLEDVRFDALFTFIYSPRVGTPAAKLPDPMSREEKLANFNRLTALQDQISAEKHAAYIGRTLRCLMDGESGDGEFPIAGRTPGNRLVRAKGSADVIGQFCQVKITGANKWSLFGEIV